MKFKYLTIEEILYSYNSDKYTLEPNTPFPQADSLERLVNFCELLYFKTEDLTNNKITELYGFDKRQTDYYYNAGCYLGLIQKVKTSDRAIAFELTNKGKNIFQLPLSQRNLEIIKLILSFRVFNESFKAYLENGAPPTKEYLVKIMKNVHLARNINETTMKRRASTIRSWLNWILESAQYQ